MMSLSDMFDTQNQVKFQLVNSGEEAILQLPMDFYNQFELTDAVQNISKFIGHQNHCIKISNYETVLENV